MTKPDDIPQDVWDAAAAAYWDIARVRGGVFDVIDASGDEAYLEFIDTVARAIMAEREACARLIDEGFDREGIQSKSDKCAHGQYGWEYCDPCASAAVRNRGAAA